MDLAGVRCCYCPGQQSSCLVLAKLSEDETSGCWQVLARPCWEAIHPVIGDSLTTHLRKAPPNPTEHSWDSYPAGFCHCHLYRPYSPKLRLTLCTLGAGGIMEPLSASSIHFSGTLTQVSSEVSGPHLVYYIQTQALASDCWQVEGYRDPVTRLCM